MTERIEQLKAFMWNRSHHAARREAPSGIELIYRDTSKTDAERTALRLKQALDAETPYFFPGELIAFTRTVPALPFVFSDEEWKKISAEHYIHELGNVSNLSPDYGSVIATGLLALKEKLGDGAEHKAMRISIDALLNLVKRYENAARAQGLTHLLKIRSAAYSRIMQQIRNALLVTASSVPYIQASRCAPA